MHEIFFFNDTATTEIYTLSLHDALPIFLASGATEHGAGLFCLTHVEEPARALRQPEHTDPKKDRKSTRLNSSHANISYAVFCLKKKTDSLYTSRPLGIVHRPAPAALHRA